MTQSIEIMNYIGTAVGILFAGVVVTALFCAVWLSGGEEMRAMSAITIVNVALFILIGYLCWLFNHWWPVLLILAMATGKQNDGGSNHGDG